MAFLARQRALVARQLLAHPRALGREHAAAEVAEHAFERLLDLVAAAAVDEAQGDGLAARAVEDDAFRLVGKVLPRHRELEPVGAGEAGQHLHVIRRGRVGLGPGHHRALGDREVVVGDDEVLVEHHLLAEAVAHRAGALRGVEAEQARLDLGDGEAADRAGELLGEGDAAGGCVVELELAPLPLAGGVGEGLVASRTLLRQALPFGAPHLFPSREREGSGVRRIEVRQSVGELERGLEAVG